MVNANHTSEMRTYDAAQITLVVDGQEIYGFKGGTDSVSVAYSSDKVTADPDSMGTTVFSINNKSDGTITVNLNQQSPCCKKLGDICNSNKVVPVDLNAGTEHTWSAQAYISKLPDMGYGDNAGVRTFAIKAADLQTEYI